MPEQNTRGRWRFTEAERGSITARFLAGVPYHALVPEQAIPPRVLRRLVLDYCLAQNPLLCQEWPSPPPASWLRRHAQEFGVEACGCPRHPLSARNEAIVERFVAGESYRALAQDYGISPERVTQIVHAYSFRQDPRAHRALIPPERAQDRIAPGPLRDHLRTLMQRAGRWHGEH